MVAVSDSSPSALFRALRLIVLLAAPVLAGMVQLAVIPPQPGMAAHFASLGYDGTFAAQLVMVIAAPAMAFGAPLIGWLASRFGKRRVLLASTLVYGLSGLACAYAPELYSLLALRVVLGFAAAGYITCAVSLIGDYYESHAARDRLLGWFAFVGGGGSIIVLRIAAELTKMGGWQAPFALNALALVIFVMAWFLVKDVRRAAVSEGVGAASGSIWSAWPIYALIVLISISMYSVTIQGAYLMNDDGIADPVVQSNVLLMSTVGSMLGAYLFRFARPALGFHLTLALTWAALALGNVGFASTANVYLLAVFAGLVGAGSGLMQPLTQGTVLNSVAPSATARAMGVALGCIFLGQLLHLPVVTPLRTEFGLRNAFLILGAASATAAALAAAWRFRAKPEPVTTH
jgi:predicted MFS family arabinose efflux permease